ncbi:MAG TPA: NUDIX hydrolase [Candidatus Limnocylindrales bacterium]|nr:NUDIX hydrolase [Candidatus Limnocylindrales bacterium]
MSIPPTLPGEALDFCSRCGGAMRTGPVDGELRDRAYCPACGFIAYRNPRLVVTALPITERGEVVLLRRGIEPGRGAWAQPGGFLEVDETVREGAVRETREETGLVVEPGAILGLYSNVLAGIVVVAFEAAIVGGELTLNEEALAFGTFGPATIPWAGVAFDTTTRALRDWVRRVDGPSRFGGATGLGD